MAMKPHNVGSVMTWYQRDTSAVQAHLTRVGKGNKSWKVLMQHYAHFREGVLKCGQGVGGWVGGGWGKDV